MNFQQKNKLCDQWRDLVVKLDTEEFFDYPLFCDTFSKTYEALESLAQEKVIPKSHMRLLLEAHAFAVVGMSGYCKECDAAGDLTLKMLMRCGIIYSEEKFTTVRDFKLKKSIPLTDVDAAIAILVEKFAADYE